MYIEVENDNFDQFKIHRVVQLNETASQAAYFSVMEGGSCGLRLTVTNPFFELSHQDCISVGFKTAEQVDEVIKLLIYARDNFAFPVNP